MGVELATTLHAPAGDQASPEVVPGNPSSAPTVERSSTEPTKLGRYVLLRRLGEGGMGVVYAAYDEELDRKVAIKLLRRALQTNLELRQRILREAQALARISDPHVIQVYEVGEHAGQLFLAMEFVNGTTLDRWNCADELRRWQDTLQMYIRAGQGLQAAHHAGLIHRDFKPENVLIGADGRPRVADFGLARLAGAPMHDQVAPPLPPPLPSEVNGPTPLQTVLTQEGHVLGTPLYMSPEQHLGQISDARSDQFSFCVALFEGLYGHLPFAGNTMAAVLRNIVANAVQLPPESSPVPMSVLQALLRGLSSDPAQRFPSMAELLSALSRGLSDVSQDPAAASQTRRRFIAIIGGFLFVTTAGLQLMRALGIDKLRSSLWMSVLFLCVATGLAVYTRKALLTNLFHRGLIAVGIAFCAQLVSLRILAVLGSFPFTHLMALDLLVLAGCTGILGAMYIPWIWTLTPVALLSSLAAVGYPRYALRISSLVTPTVVVATLYLWSRAAAARRQAAERMSKP